MPCRYCMASYTPQVFAYPPHPLENIPFKGRVHSQMKTHSLSSHLNGDRKSIKYFGSFTVKQHGSILLNNWWSYRIIDSSVSILSRAFSLVWRKLATQSWDIHTIGCKNSLISLMHVAQRRQWSFSQRCKQWFFKLLWETMTKLDFFCEQFL